MRPLRQTARLNFKALFDRLLRQIAQAVNDGLLSARADFLSPDFDNVIPRRDVISKIVVIAAVIQVAFDDVCRVNLGTQVYP